MVAPDSKLLKPRNINRLVLLLGFLAPLVYLFGTQFFALAGAHGEEVLADVSNLDLRGPVYTDYVGNQEHIEFANNYFGVSYLNGYSVVQDDGTILSSSSSKMYYSYNGFDDSIDLPNLTLRSSLNAFDTLSADGVFTRRVGILAFDSLERWSFDGNVYIFSFSNALMRRGAHVLCSLPYFPTKGDTMPDWSYTFSGAGFFEVKVPVGTTIAQLRERLSGQNATYTLATPVVSQVDFSLAEYYFAESPVSISFDSAISQGFEFVSWGYVGNLDSYSDTLFGSMFNDNNFLADLGKETLKDNPKGFAPYGNLIKFLDDTVFHMSDNSLALMGYGYVYYCGHVVLLDLIALILLFIPRLIAMVLEFVTKGVDTR